MSDDWTYVADLLRPGLIPGVPSSKPVNLLAPCHVLWLRHLSKMKRLSTGALVSMAAPLAKPIIDRRNRAVVNMGSIVKEHWIFKLKSFSQNGEGISRSGCLTVTESSS